jgi:hypothetical protein
VKIGVHQWLKISFNFITQKDKHENIYFKGGVLPVGRSLQSED